MSSTSTFNKLFTWADDKYKYTFLIPPENERDDKSYQSNVLDALKKLNSNLYLSPGNNGDEWQLVSGFKTMPEFFLGDKKDVGWKVACPINEFGSGVELRLTMMLKHTGCRSSCPAEFEEYNPEKKPDQTTVGTGNSAQSSNERGKPKMGEAPGQTNTHNRPSPVGEGRLTAEQDLKEDEVKPKTKHQPPKNPPPEAPTSNQGRDKPQETSTPPMKEAPVVSDTADETLPKQTENDGTNETENERSSPTPREGPERQTNDMENGNGSNKKSTIDQKNKGKANKVRVGHENRGLTDAEEVKVYRVYTSDPQSSDMEAAWSHILKTLTNSWGKGWSSKALVRYKSHVMRRRSMWHRAPNEAPKLIRSKKMVGQYYWLVKIKTPRKAKSNGAENPVAGTPTDLVATLKTNLKSSGFKIEENRSDVRDEVQTESQNPSNEVTNNVARPSKDPVNKPDESPVPEHNHPAEPASDQTSRPEEPASPSGNGGVDPLVTANKPPVTKPKDQEPPPAPTPHELPKITPRPKPAPVPEREASDQRMTGRSGNATQGSILEQLHEANRRMKQTAETDDEPETSNEPKMTPEAVDVNFIEDKNGYLVCNAFVLDSDCTPRLYQELSSLLKTKVENDSLSIKKPTATTTIATETLNANVIRNCMEDRELSKVKYKYFGLVADEDRADMGVPTAEAMKTVKQLLPGLTKLGVGLNAPLVRPAASQQPDDETRGDENQPKKNPPTLPPRKAKPGSVPGDRGTPATNNSSTRKTPAKFFGLEDNVTTQSKSQQSRILVLVKYSDIEEIRKTHPKETVQGVKQDKYKTFSPTKLASELVKFNASNSVLKPLMLRGNEGYAPANADGYKTALGNPIKQEYKDTGIEVSTWNLLIPKQNGTPLAKNEVEKIQELVKILKDHGVAVRREKDLKLK